jgi:hypothetical protein
VVVVGRTKCLVEKCDDLVVRLVLFVFFAGILVVWRLCMERPLHCMVGSRSCAAILYPNYIMCLIFWQGRFINMF